MNEFVSNSQIYTMTSENELSQILSNFNTNYILDIVHDNLRNVISTSYQFTKPNIVHSYENAFKELVRDFEFGKEQIFATRTETFNDIINIVCNYYNLGFNNANDNIDYFSAASIIYDFLVSRFEQHLTEFFTRYLIQEKDQIYQALNLDSFKKNKDSGTTYGKKIFLDPKIAIISANLKFILHQISAYSIPMETIIQFCYPVQDAMFLLSLISDNGDFYHTAYQTVIMNDDIIPEIITNIRTAFMNLCQIQETSPLQIIKGE